MVNNYLCIFAEAREYLFAYNFCIRMSTSANQRHMETMELLHLGKNQTERKMANKGNVEREMLTTYLVH